MRSLYNSSSMGVLRYHHRLSTAIAFSLLFLLSSLSSEYVSSFATLSKAPQELSGGLGDKDTKRSNGSEEMKKMMNRRRLGRLGSAPPTCKSKCGRCLPCKPVHVPIQPGRSMTLEYYPEAWRCKCGNKLFMP